MFENMTDLSTTRLHLTADGVVASADAPPSGTLWTLAAFAADDDRSVHSDVWECHPTGDEMITMLSGAIGVHLRGHDGGESPAAVLRPGRGVVVPAGEWHRLTVVEPGVLLSLTPRAGTRHERDDALGRRR
jgi:mannose-6-phosphate isomerase-like protein (cupin superfamily)